MWLQSSLGDLPRLHVEQHLAFRSAVGGTTIPAERPTMNAAATGAFAVGRTAAIELDTAFAHAIADTIALVVAGFTGVAPAYASAAVVTLLADIDDAVAAILQHIGAGRHAQGRRRCRSYRWRRG